MTTLDASAAGPDVPLDAARELLVALVSIPSPSGAEAAAAERLAAFFAAHDREVWIDDVGNVRAPADDGVLLTSHVDTVPGEIPVRVSTGDEATTDPSNAADASAVEPGADAVLWGRGSVDATGPLAAMAVAAVRTGVSFAGVVGEETDSRGARHLVETRDEPDAVVNGEPSGTDGITLGYRGLLCGTYAVSTDSRHSSRPEPNAIQRAMTWWAAVETAFDEDSRGAESDGPTAVEPDPDGERSVVEQVTPKPVRVEGAAADDGLTVEATLDFQVRTPPGTSMETIRDRLQTLAATHGGSIAWTDAIEPVQVSPRTPVARAFRTAVRAEDGEPRLLRKTGTSDMNIYAEAWSCPMATYGPGDAALDHAPDERLRLAAFDRSIAVLERVAATLSNDRRSRSKPTATDRATDDGTHAAATNPSVPDGDST